MPYKLVFTGKAIKDLKKLPPDIAGKIIKKLKFYTTAPNPLEFAKRLKGERAVFRFGIGDYRAKFILRNNTVYIFRIGHRKDIYK
jgi:mRNA interferase RelE/StbE